MTTEYDQNGRNAYYDDWLWGCREGQNKVASNGERVTAALALQIAHDLLRFIGGANTEPLTWTHEDYLLARAALSGIRAQQGVMGPDAEFLGFDEGLYATHQIDIWVYG